jgi:hypothetical protein
MNYRNKNRELNISVEFVKEIGRIIISLVVLFLVFSRQIKQNSPNYGKVTTLR